MAELPFLDSFDHYLSADANQKYTSSLGLSIGAGYGRRGTNGGIVQGGGMFKTFDVEYGILYVGAAISGPASTIFTFRNQLSGVNLSLCYLDDGRMVFGATDPTGGWFNNIAFTQVAKPFLTGVFHYIEMMASVSTSGVSGIVRVNEEIVLQDSAFYAHPEQLTNNPHIAWAQVQFGGRGGGYFSVYDDLYINTGKFYGDINIDVIRPNGPSTTNWIPTPNVANWLNVRDITPDGDATTVSSAKVNDVDLYTMEDIPLAAIVRAIQGIASIKKDTAGLAAVKLQYDGGGGTHYSKEFYPSEGAYAMLRDGREDITNPADINGMLFGQVRTK
jgi:hypothetical protein